MSDGSLKRLVAKLVDFARSSPGEVGMIGLLGLAVVSTTAFLYFNRAEPPPPPIRKDAGPAPTASPIALTVHVAGLVNKPGVYALPEVSRVKDAIDLAGGPAAGGDVNALNLAAPIEDGMKIYVPPAPSNGIQPAPGLAGQNSSQSAAAAPGAKVNLNSAGPDELEELPGIGEVLAERIIAYRQREGGFRSVKDLLNVEGIGQKKFESIKDLVSV